MDTCKYIVYEDSDYGVEVIALFSPMTQHLDFARKLGVKPTSAGFMRMSASRPHCYGDSFSLKLKANPERDERLARRMLGIDD